MLGVASITPAFPQIARELNLSSQSVGLLIIAFTTPGVILAPFIGIVADRYGRKRILIPSLFLFGIAGGACSIFSSFDILIIFRLLQGIGAASLGMLNVTIIGDLFSGQKRTEAMGYNVSVLGIGAASYPAIGGAIALVGWRYIFLLPLLAIPIGFLAIFSLNNPEPSSKQNIKQYLVKSWEVLSEPQVISLFLVSVTTFIIIYGAFMTYLPFFMDKSFKSSSLVNGLVLSVMSLVMAIT